MKKILTAFSMAALLGMTTSAHAWWGWGPGTAGAMAGATSASVYTRAPVPMVTDTVIHIALTLTTVTGLITEVIPTMGMDPTTADILMGADPVGLAPAGARLAGGNPRKGWTSSRRDYLRPPVVAPP